jgi:hypothetical protein
MNFKLPHDVRTPGILTTVTQEIDVRRLDDRQFVRLRNCAKRGWVLGMGYISAILQSLAERHNLMMPVLARRSYDSIYVHHEVLDRTTATYDPKMVEEIMNLSDVRKRFYDSRKGQLTGNSSLSKVTDGGLYLAGWVDEDPSVLRKEIVSRLEKLPFFVSSCKALAEIVDTRPHVETHRQVH